MGLSAYKLLWALTHPLEMTLQMHAFINPLSMTFSDITIYCLMCFTHDTDTHTGRQKGVGLTKSRPWVRKFSCHSCRDLNPGPFNHKSSTLTTELSLPHMMREKELGERKRETTWESRKWKRESKGGPREGDREIKRKVKKIISGH